ncbi:hypothetical protein MRX96_057346 [Rhipicephalus microplus]
MTATRRQDLDIVDFQDSTASSLSTPKETNDQNAETDRKNQADGALQTVLTLWRKEALAKEKKAKSMDFSMTSYHQEISTAEATGKSKYRLAYRRLPPCPNTT